MSKKIQALTFPTPTFYLRRQVLARFPFENRYSAMQFPKLSLARSSNVGAALSFNNVDIQRSFSAPLDQIEALPSLLLTL